MSKTNTAKNKTLTRVLIAILVMCSVFALLFDKNMLAVAESASTNNLSVDAYSPVSGALSFSTVEEQSNEYLWVIYLLGGVVLAELILLIPLLRRRKRLKAGSNKMLALAPIWLLALVPTWQIYTLVALGVLCVSLAIVEISIFVQDNKKVKQLKLELEKIADMTFDQDVPDVAQPQLNVLPTETLPEDALQQQVEPPLERESKLGDGKKIAYRYNFSFKAKLIQSGDEIQSRYGVIMDNVTACKKAKTTSSWKQQRIYTGRQTLAVLTFRGKKLCVCFALDPKDYERTKYHGVDLSELKSYQKTPLMLKLTSERKLKYALHLLKDLLQKYELTQGEVVPSNFTLPYQSTEQLVEQGLVKVVEAEELGAQTEEQTQELATEQIAEQQELESTVAQDVTEETKEQPQEVEVTQSIEQFESEQTQQLVNEQSVEPILEQDTPQNVESQPEPQIEQEIVDEDVEQDEQEVDESQPTQVVIGGKQVFYHYNFSFKAKLIQSGEEIQSRYGAIMDNVTACKKAKTTSSWKQQRIYTGRQTLAVLTFRGKKLCVCFALDPKNYEGTKYHGVDLSELKSYQKTPLMIKLTSERKLKYALHLWNEVIARFGLTSSQVVPTQFSLDYKPTEELIEQGLVKVVCNESIQEGDQVEKANISELIRDKISMKEAQATLTNDVAATLVEDKQECSIDMEETEKEEKYRNGVCKAVINIDTLSANFMPDEVVTLKKMKAKKLVAKKTTHVKVLARGILNKPLTIIANDFSMDAVKMIVLTGGRAVKKS